MFQILQWFKTFNADPDPLPAFYLDADPDFGFAIKQEIEF
jgi:hypothetical protein